MIQKNIEDSTKNPPRFGGGPLGLGDPDDNTLRKTEKDVILPKLMNEEAKKKCSETIKAFLECTKSAGIFLPFKCQKQNEENNKCISSWLRNPEFVEEVTNKYLLARSHYRKTGEPIERYQRVKSSSSLC